MKIGKPKELIKFLLEQDKDKLYEVKQHREKRSLTANAYAWVLISKIAEVLRVSNEEVYAMALKDYAPVSIIRVASDIDISGFVKHYEPTGYFYWTEGIKYAEYMCFMGSSEYDTKQMARFIDGLISDAKALGIETLPPDEIDRMKSAWNDSASN